MPAIEELLRDELRRVTDAVRPDQLRPLRIPVRRRRWHLHLLPVAAAAAVIVVVAAAVLLARMAPGPTGPGPTGTPTPSPPPYYLTFTYVIGHGPPYTEAVIRDSVSGKVTGTVTVPSDGEPYVTATAARDDRSFVIGSYEIRPAGAPDYRFFLLRISAGGAAAHLTELPYPVLPSGHAVTGIALSPDGTLLAVSLSMEFGPSAPVGELEVINLATRGTQAWTVATQGGHYYIPGPPSWADGDRMIAFTWNRGNVNTPNTVMEGVRLLEVATPGGSLMDSKWIVSGQSVAGTIASALITPDGRDVVVGASRSIASGGHHGTAVMQVVEVQTGSGRPVRVLRAQTARSVAYTLYSPYGSCDVVSLDPTGRYALVQCPRFGWLDIGGPQPGRFTPLPGQVLTSAAW